MIRSKIVSWVAVASVALMGSIAVVAHAATPPSADEAAVRAQTTN